jgi:hypothetical protein
LRINFYSGDKTLVQVGADDAPVKVYGGRVETFEIGTDEQLIGCELSYCDRLFRGVTWLKIILPSPNEQSDKSV